jgi:hypothetical protein
MTFAKTFAAVFLAIILAAGLIFVLGQVGSVNKKNAELRQFLFDSAIKNEAYNWAWHHSKEDPDQRIYQTRLAAIRKAEEAGDPSPPKFLDSYATLKQAVILPDGTAILPVGTGLEFVSFQQDGTVRVRYSAVDMTLPASAVEVK